MTKIIAFGGKKGSGKTTACNYLAGIHLTAAGVIPDFFGFPDGNIYDGQNEQIKVNELDQDVVRVYNFADGLKEFCVSTFGLDPAKVYGLDTDKNSKTHLLWEDMPGNIPNEALFNATDKFLKRKTTLGLANKLDTNHLFFYHEPGPMTVREVLQFFGTEICRRMFSPCWIQNTLARIQKDAPAVAFVADVRFDDEAMALHAAGGYVYLLLKNSESQDSHASENGFVDFQGWAGIIDNRETDNRAFYRLLVETLSPDHINLKKV